MKRVFWAVILAVAIGVVASAMVALNRPDRTVLAPYASPEDGTITRFSSKGTERSLLSIEAATDVSFMRPFIEAFQASNPGVTVIYVDFISSIQSARARSACDRRATTADIYLTVATDSLVKLANDGCAAALPKRITRNLPDWAQWRGEVLAFSLEPAVFVYNTDVVAVGSVPVDHLDLIEKLRSEPLTWRRKLGTYDIEDSGSGYLYAGVDARQQATYGRLIESFGRSEIRTFCCSNAMVSAVARRDILLAYNVQMSYASAAKRAGEPIGIVVPRDYQAVLTRSVMVTRDARHRDLANAFIEFLISPPGQAIAREQLAPFDGPTVGHPVSGIGQKSPIAVGPVLLGLADHARRAEFTREWRDAIKSRSGQTP